MTTTRAVVPLDELGHRLPVAGRIRVGELVQTSNGRTRPASRGTFRFTSSDVVALEQLAAMYGGRVQPWSDPRVPEGLHELCTDAAEMAVLLTPEPLTASYELWTGAGCARRCDGRRATVYDEPGDHPDGVDAPCVCTATGHTECALVTRVELLLEHVRFAGSWVLRTASIFAAVELPAVVELAHRIHGPGLVPAVLRIAQRRSVVQGEVKRYTVPMLALTGSIGSLTARTAPPELTAGPAAIDTPATVQPAAAVPPPPIRIRHLFGAMGRAGISDADRHEWASGWLGRDVQSFTTLTDLEVMKLTVQAEAESESDDDEDEKGLISNETLGVSTAQGTTTPGGVPTCAVCAELLADGRPVTRAPAGGYQHRECAA